MAESLCQGGAGRASVRREARPAGVAMAGPPAARLEARSPGAGRSPGGRGEGRSQGRAVGGKGWTEQAVEPVSSSASPLAAGEGLWEPHTHIQMHTAPPSPADAGPHRPTGGGMVQRSPGLKAPWITRFPNTVSKQTEQNKQTENQTSQQKTLSDEQTNGIQCCSGQLDKSIGKQ